MTENILHYTDINQKSVIGKVSEPYFKKENHTLLNIRRNWNNYDMLHKKIIDSIEYTNDIEGNTYISKQNILEIFNKTLYKTDLYEDFVKGLSFLGMDFNFENYLNNSFENIFKSKRIDSRDLVYLVIDYLLFPFNFFDNCTFYSFDKKVELKNRTYSMFVIRRSNTYISGLHNYLITDNVKYNSAIFKGISGKILEPGEYVLNYKTQEINGFFDYLFDSSYQYVITPNGKHVDYSITSRNMLEDFIEDYKDMSKISQIIQENFPYSLDSQASIIFIPCIDEDSNNSFFNQLNPLSFFLDI